MLDESTFRRLSEIGAKTVLVQVPEGLKAESAGIVRELEERGLVCILSVEPCFGACDLRDTEAKRLGCDALLHIGHSDFGVKPVLPVVYDTWESDFDPVNVIRSSMDMLKGFKSIGLAATVQHTAGIPKAASFLKAHGKRVFAGRSGTMGEGQVLGCDCTGPLSVDGSVDCHVFIGSGMFHPVHIASRTGKPVFRAAPGATSLEIVHADREKAEVKRQLRIEKARGCGTFAVFLCTKPGQSHVRRAVETRDMLVKKGKEAIIITADMLTPEKITGMGIEAIVNTACPRIYDDQKLFGVVVLNPPDAEEL